MQAQKLNSWGTGVHAVPHVSPPLMGAHCPLKTSQPAEGDPRMEQSRSSAEPVLEPMSSMEDSRAGTEQWEPRGLGTHREGQMRLRREIQQMLTYTEHSGKMLTGDGSDREAGKQKIASSAWQGMCASRSVPRTWPDQLLWRVGQDCEQGAQQGEQAREPWL